MQGTPMRAADGSLIRCPKCRWVPVQEARWSCNCGHIRNRFRTRGICPACQYQWRLLYATAAMKHLATPPGTGWDETEGASKPELGNVHHLNRRQAGCDPPKCLKSLIFGKFHPGLASREQLTGNPVSQALRYAGRASKRLPDNPSGIVAS
jgi:hypothetical protein